MELTPASPTDSIDTAAEASIFAFADYRDFLKRRYERIRANDSRFSFQFCARQLGTTRSYLKLVIDKKRHMGLDKLPGVFKLFHLTPYERESFTFLYLRTLAGSSEMQGFFTNALGALQSGAAIGKHYSAIEPYTSLDQSLMTGWLSMALHSAASLEGFEPTVAWVRAHVRGKLPSDAEIISTLNELTAAGAIVAHRQPDGTVRHRAVEVDLCRLRPQHKSGWDILRVGGQRCLDVLNDTAAHRPNHFSLRFVELTESGVKQFQEALANFHGEIGRINATPGSATKTVAYFDSYHTVSSAETSATVKATVKAAPSRSTVPIKEANA